VPVVGAHICAHDARAAGVGARKAGDDVDQGGLAGAVRTEQAEELALLDGERPQLAVVLFNAGDFDRFQCRKLSTP
jgi:hypothetical protein